MNALIDLLKAVCGLFGVMVVWLAIQAFVRRGSGCGRDRDMLDSMLHGCGGCANREVCSRNKERTPAR